jgi:hypothetical protein
MFACSDESPPGPNLIVDNESAGEVASFILVNEAGDTVLDKTVAVAERYCTTLDVALVHGEVRFAADTVVLTPVWLAETNTWSRAYYLRSGPTVVETTNLRSCATSQ